MRSKKTYDTLFSLITSSPEFLAKAIAYHEACDMCVYNTTDGIDNCQFTPGEACVQGILRALKSKCSEANDGSINIEHEGALSGETSKDKRGESLPVYAPRVPTPKMAKPRKTRSNGLTRNSSTREPIRKRVGWWTAFMGDSSDSDTLDGVQSNASHKSSRVSKNKRRVAK